jgi:CheY-like chemotaxis protein
MSQVECKRKNLKINFKWDDPTIYVRGDSFKLKQILLNLLSNAIKFTPEQGEITVSMEQLEQIADHVILQFTVKDTGAGMTDEEKERLFERFAQASQRTFQEYGGSGLGLVISKHLIELMGGKIEVNSQKWRGTKFTFTVNCQRVVQEAKKTKPVVSKLFTPKGRGVTGLSVLIVEDNLINQKILQRLLTQQGYQCVVASNGKEAVEIFEKTPVDIIFMDVQMPIMSGVEATQAIRKLEEGSSWQRPPVPIIGLSGDASKECINKGMLSGMNDYVVKPYEINQLCEKITCYTQAISSSSTAMPTVSPPVAFAS